MRILISILSTLVFLFIFSPSRATALTSCSGGSGHCVWTGICASGGLPLDPTGCSPFQKCCPNIVLPEPELKCTTPTGEGINTAVGCISTDIESGGLIQSVLALSVGLGGGIALLLMLYGTFVITTSAGIPDKLKAGQEIITSAIIGLVIIILSIVLMNLIGVQLLAIPGF